MATVAQTESESGYPGLKRQVLQLLLSGEYPIGARFHSVREVAQWPGATNHLAQRVLQELCREGYLESVPKKGLFVRTPPRQGRVGDGNGAGGDRWRRLLFLVPPGTNKSRINDLLPIVSDSLDAERWGLEIVYLRDDYAAEGGFRFAENIVARNPSAVVWCMPFPADMLLVRYLVTRGLPVVTYNRDFTGTGAMGVVADTSQAARHLFECLYAQGRRRFALVTIDKFSPSIQQFGEVAAQTAAEHGVTNLQRVTLHYQETSFPDAQGQREIDALLGGPDRPDGILCAESYSLLAVEQWLARHRDVRVPKDLGVASFDRMPVRHVVRVLPPIPTADMDHWNMMQAAVEMIEAELAGRRVEQKLRSIPAVLLDAREAVRA